MSFPVRKIDALARTTRRFTWVGSGVTPSQITSALIDASETVVSSASAVSSGDGHYYMPTTMPNTPGWYVNEWCAYVNSYPYYSRQLVRVRDLETD